MRINHELAQEIAQRIMKVIPYNVNIMDENGMIIGSGDPTRINTFHEGAYEAINKREMVTIYKPNPNGARPGVNLPIFFQDEVIGVIGISGDPKIVTPFASLVKITAELLIRQEYLYTERRIKEKLKEEFLYQWIYRTEPYDDSFRNRSETLGIDLDTKWKAVIVKGDDNYPLPLLDANEYMIRYNLDTLLFIAPEHSAIISKLKKILAGKNAKIGIGESHQILAKSVNEAVKAIQIAEKMELSGTDFYYRDLKFIDYIVHPDLNDRWLENLIKELENKQKGIPLVETLISYIENNGDVQAITEQLHIHRNSLAYRLQKIEAITHKNPKNFIDLFQLFIGYILYKMDAPNRNKD